MSSFCLFFYAQFLIIISLMKPEDLKSPFSWDKRHILIKDRVWYVPEYYANYDEFTFPGWDHVDLFGNKNPVCVEYCSGNGAWIAAKAQENPHLNWVAVEMKFGRARKIWSKIQNLQLKNLIVVVGEGFIVTNNYFPKNSISQVYVNFPDPWPKKRHWKHRIIQTKFLTEMSRILELDGVMTFVTDDFDYSVWTIDTFLNHADFASCHPEKHFVTEFPNYGNSYFEDLWREKGKVIRYHQFRKAIA